MAQFNILQGLACLAAISGQARLAAQLMGAEEVMRTKAGASSLAMLAGQLANSRHSAVAALGPTKFEAEFKVGQRMGRDAAIAIALGEPPHVATVASYIGGRNLLGTRQSEVAELVAEGLSNKQIGARLFLSVHTVDSHVRSILNRLGLNSRAEIARWTASNH